MTGSVVVVADAGPQAGLGHIGRSSAVAAALRSRAIDARCYAHGGREPFTFDGVDWAPLEGDGLPSFAEHVLLVDSYRLPHQHLDTLAASHALVFMHDYGEAPRGAALVVSVGAGNRRGDGWLCGLSYAALRPGFWGLPTRQLRERVERVLVTTGSGKLAETGGEIASAVVRGLPEATVTLVLGPHALAEAPGGVEVLDAPASLLEPLLESDLVVSAAGQSLLEAAASGTPCVGLPLVENQRRQAGQLAGLGGITLVEPPTPGAAAAACVELAGDVEARRGLSRAAQRAVDGYGALRVAFEIDRLVAGS